MATEKPFGRWSGVGLVIANMVGAGVFLSTGFMALSMPPGRILLAWVVGGVLALAGARAYAEVARLVPQGGGEYRYLSTLLHPSLGYLAGWGSLLLGFSAPIAVDALAAGAFAKAVVSGLESRLIAWLPIGKGIVWVLGEPRLFAAALVIGLTLLHAAGLDLSARLQNGLVAVKVLLLAGFVLVCLFSGTLAFPTWAPTPPPNEDVAGGFASSLFYIAFAYSGWNAAIYAADEFKEPKKDVPFAMLVGCLLVGALYLVVNYVFVANLTPEQGTVVFHYDDFTSLKGQWDQVTLGQAVVAHLLGPNAAKVMSGVMVLLFTSAISAMTLVGPRVYAAMAGDGFLPAVLKGKGGEPPKGAVLLQGALALLLLFTNDVRSVLGTVGAILVLFAALTASGLFRARLVAKTPEEKPGLASLAAASLYVLSAVLMLWFGFKSNPVLLAWIGAAAVIGIGAWYATHLIKRRAAGGTS